MRLAPKSITGKIKIVDGPLLDDMMTSFFTKIRGTGPDLTFTFVCKEGGFSWAQGVNVRMWEMAYEGYVFRGRFERDEGLRSPVGYTITGTYNPGSKSGKAIIKR